MESNTPEIRVESIAYNFNTVFKAFDRCKKTGLVVCAVANLIGVQDYS